jgi:SWI/SNF-related matrix-associated actin-dependent regulator of chromatin subfamily A member 5
MQRAESALLSTMQAIKAKMACYRNPWLELKIQYGANKNKAYTEEEDRFLLCMMHRLGYGAWDEMKAEIRKSWRFRFDWFFKSRTPVELNRRCDTLIRLIEKENEEAEVKQKNGKKEGGKKRKAAGDGPGPSKRVK